MASVCLYFQIHQPFRLKPYQVFHIGKDHQYFHSEEGGQSSNKAILHKVAKNSYLPGLKLIRDLLEDNEEFKVSFSISGMAIEQFEQYAPEVLELLSEIGKNPRVEFLAETYYHSLAAVYSQNEFASQVRIHHEKMHDLFGKSPTAFRNTELIYENNIAAMVEQMGYEVVLAEGADDVLGWKSPNFVYTPSGAENLRLMLKNYRLSDDIAFRFSDRNWSEWPLTADKYADWVARVNGNGYVVNLFLDFETLGEHHGDGSGIFDFFRHLPKAILSRPDMEFATVTEAAMKYSPVDLIDVPNPTSWADTKRDLSAWTENAMQRSALKAIYDLEDKVLDSGKIDLISDWRKLQTSDHFYYMSTKLFTDGEVHAYFSPYESPYSAFTNYMNVIHDITYRLNQSLTNDDA